MANFYIYYSKCVNMHLATGRGSLECSQDTVARCKGQLAARRPLRSTEGQGRDGSKPSIGEGWIIFHHQFLDTPLVSVYQWWIQEVTNFNPQSREPNYALLPRGSFKTRNSASARSRVPTVLYTKRIENAVGEWSSRTLKVIGLVAVWEHVGPSYVMFLSSPRFPESTVYPHCTWLWPG